MKLLTIADYEDAVWRVFPEPICNVLFGRRSSAEHLANFRNVDAFDRFLLRPRVLAGAAERDLSTTALGQTLPFPVMVAPFGTHQRFHPEGELAVARAAGRCGTVMALGSSSTFSIEEVADVASGPLFFQLYFSKDRELNRILIQRAEERGYKALLVTVDNITVRADERELRYDYQMLGPNSTRNAFVHTLDPARLFKNYSSIPNRAVPTQASALQTREQNLTWADIDWLRSVTKLPIVIKGIQTAEDAKICAEHQLAGLVVSNHGGLALNGGKGTVEMLPEITEAVGGRLEIFLDGGIRRGADVLKAVALGAKAVFVGRAVIWGLILDGENGVFNALQILKNELSAAMGACGVKDIKAVNSRLVELTHWYNPPA